MKYKIVLQPTFNKKIKKLDKYVSKQIAEYIKNKLVENDNVLSELEPLKGNLKGYYKIKPLKDYRMLASIENDIITIFLLDLEHRKQSYLIWDKLKKNFFK